MSEPGIVVTYGSDKDGLPLTFITQKHDLPPHHPVATLVLRGPAEVAKLVEKLSFALPQECQA